MDNNSQEKKQNRNYQLQNQGQAYPQMQSLQTQKQEPADPQLQLQKSLLYQQPEDQELSEQLEQNVPQFQQPERKEQDSPQYQQPEKLQQFSLQSENTQLQYQDPQKLTGEPPQPQLQNDLSKCKQDQLCSQQIQEIKISNQPIQNTEIPNQPIQNTEIPNELIQNTEIPNEPIQNTEIPNQPIQNTKIPNERIQNTEPQNQQELMQSPPSIHTPQADSISQAQVSTPPQIAQVQGSLQQSVSQVQATPLQPQILQIQTPQAQTPPLQHISQCSPVPPQNAPTQQYQQPYNPYPCDPSTTISSEEAISFSDWMITFLLLCIPVANIVLLILWAFGKKSKRSKANYAKAALVWVFIWTLIGFTLFTVFWGIMNGTLRF